MAFEVPGLFGKVELDIAPLKRGFAQVKADAVRFSGEIAPELTKTLSVDVAPAVQNLQKLESEVKAHVDRIQAEGERVQKLFAAPAQQMQHLLPGPVQQFQKLLPGPGDLTASSMPAHIAAPSVAVDVAPLKAGLDQARAEVQKFSATVAPELHQKLTLDTGGGVDKLEQLKAEFQAQTDSMKAEAGALQERIAARQAAISSRGMSASQTGFAIAGLSVAAHQIDELAQKTEKVALQFQAGAISGRELTAQLLRSVPIAGDLGDAMSRVYSFLDGDTQYVAEINRQLAAQEVHMHNLNAAAAETKKWTEQTADLVGQVQTEIKALSLSGVPLKLFEIDADIQAKIEAIKKQLPTIHAESDKAFTAEILANKAETQKLYDQLNAKAADLNKLIGTDDHPLSVPDLLSRKIPMEGIGVNANAVQSDLRDLNGRIQTFNEKNRKLREQISKDETSAAADAERQITALTQEGVEKRAKIMRDALMGGMSRDYEVFGEHVMKVWDNIGKKIEQQQAQISRMFQTIDRELATAAGGDRFDQMLSDFKKLNPTPDQLEAFKKKIQQERDLAVTPSSRFSAADTIPPLVRPDDRLPAFLKPGSADAARLQFNLGMDSYQRQRDEVQKQQLDEAKKQTGVLLELNDGLKFTVLDTF